MLVLTRKLQQQIKIGDQITVTILRVKGNTVRVGVQAPREVRVVRGELPKVAAAQTDEVGEGATVVESIVAIADISAEASLETCEEEAVAAVESGYAAGETPAPPAAHLPLKRIRDRHGAGPLKQVLASCATLAK